MWFLMLLVGLIGGLIGGMGMGGGTLTIPLLTLILHFEQLAAQGINLIAFIPMSVVALIIHAQNHLVDFKLTWGLAVVGCLFSLGGSLLAHVISVLVLKKMFALFLILIGIWQFIELKKENKKNNKVG